MKRKPFVVLTVVTFLVVLSAKQSVADVVSAELDRCETHLSSHYFKGTVERVKIIEDFLDRMEAKPYPLASPAQEPPDKKMEFKERLSQEDEMKLRGQMPTGYYKEFVGMEDKEVLVKEKLDFWEVKIALSSGYRLDELNWNIAGNIYGTDPNILSELSWTDLQIFQLEADAQFIWRKRLRLEGSLGYGWIYKGDNQDSDYLGDNRTLEFSRSNNSGDGDDVFDWSLGLGYQFSLGDVSELLAKDVWLAVLGGYSYHEQNLRMKDGFQTIPATGAFGGLNSTYQAEWKGPWIGVEVSGKKDRLIGFARFEYHWADYYAEADWNLRSDFLHPVSYIHTADGTGSTISLGGGYLINDDWSIYLKADIKDWEAEGGRDRTFFTTGSVVDTRLNEVNWDSYAIMLGATYTFSNKNK